MCLRHYWAGKIPSSPSSVLHCQPWASVQIWTKGLRCHITYVFACPRSKTGQDSSDSKLNWNSWQIWGRLLPILSWTLPSSFTLCSCLFKILHQLAYLDKLPSYESGHLWSDTNYKAKMNQKFLNSLNALDFLHTDCEHHYSIEYFQGHSFDS